MKRQLEQRLLELREEFSNGQQKLAELEESRNRVHETLLRISGAIQVLEEELGEKTPESKSSDLPKNNGKVSSSDDVTTRDLQAK